MCLRGPVPRSVISLTLNRRGHILLVRVMALEDLAVLVVPFSFAESSATTLAGISILSMLPTGAVATSSMSTSVSTPSVAHAGPVVPALIGLGIRIHTCVVSSIPALVRGNWAVRDPGVGTIWLSIILPEWNLGMLRIHRMIQLSLQRIFPLALTRPLETSLMRWVGKSVPRCCIGVGKAAIASGDLRTSVARLSFGGVEVAPVATPMSLDVVRLNRAGARHMCSTSAHVQRGSCWVLKALRIVVVLCGFLSGSGLVSGYTGIVSLEGGWFIASMLDRFAIGSGTQDATQTRSWNSLTSTAQFGFFRLKGVFSQENSVRDLSPSVAAQNLEHGNLLASSLLPVVEATTN